MPTLVQFRLKNPFEAVCETCKEKKLCRSVQFKAGDSFAIRQFKSEEHTFCEGCLSLQHSRSFRYTPCTPEELQEKIRVREDIRINLKDMPKKKQMSKTRYVMRRPIHVSRTESY